MTERISLFEFTEWNPTQAHKSLFGDRCNGRGCPLKDKCHFGNVVMYKGHDIAERYKVDKCENFKPKYDTHEDYQDEKVVLEKNTFKVAIGESYICENNHYAKYLKLNDVVKVIDRTMRFGLVFFLHGKERHSLEHIKFEQTFKESE